MATVVAGSVALVFWGEGATILPSIGFSATSGWALGGEERDTRAVRDVSRSTILSLNLGSEWLTADALVCLREASKQVTLIDMGR
jgi:hypothetical protein